MNTNNEQSLFALFLEGQNFPQVKTNVKAGSEFPPFPAQPFPTGFPGQPINEHEFLPPFTSK